MTPSPPPEPEEKGWIAHDGGECPVPPGQHVNLLLRDGDTSLTQPAGWCCWQHNLPGEHRGYDIIAYRVVSK